MIRAGAFFLVLVAPVLLGAPAGAQKMSFVMAEGRGDGTTRIDATQSALIMAIGQVNGAEIAAQMSSQLKAQTTVDEDNETFRSEESFQQAVSQRTKGVVRSWTVLSETKDDEGIWTVTVRANVAKYKLSRQLSRLRIAILPLRLSSQLKNPADARDFGKRVQRSILAYLTQSRRFAVLDRDFGKEQSKELQFVNKPGVRAEELARLGNLVAVDLIVVGTLEDFHLERRSVTVKATGRKIHSKKWVTNISFRAIDVATKQVKYAGSLRKGLEDSNATLADAAGNAIGRKILNAIYPILVVAVDGRTLTLGQGGRTLHVGDELELFKLGKRLVDPYTKESLGRRESLIGRVRISNVRAKQSSAKIIKSRVKIEDQFAPRTFVVRPVPGKTGPNVVKKQAVKDVERELKSDTKDLEEKSKDDW